MLFFGGAVGRRRESSALFAGVAQGCVHVLQSVRQLRKR